MKMDLNVALPKLLNYCIAADFKGYDPYDGLYRNGKTETQKDSKWQRLFKTHLNKRSPINFRSFQSIPSAHNAKGLALFLSGMLKLYQRTQDEQYRQQAGHLIDLIIQNQIDGYAGACWGYYFPWQSRAFYIPANTPSIVVTSFVADALLDAAEILNNENCYQLASSSQNFVLQDLNRSYKNEGYCLSYSPLDWSRVYNANIQGASLLARLYQLEQKPEQKNAIVEIVNYLRNVQNADGSWYYGEAANQKWIDNYHTVFILDALFTIQTILPDLNITPMFQKGLEFYTKQLFKDGIIPKFYAHKTFPIEPHCGAAAIILFTKISNRYGQYYLQQAHRIAEWLIQNMQDKQGYFYFQKNKLVTNKISYMRWVQAWMFKALSYLKSVSISNQKNAIESFEK
jgi:uncharacterized protein YyaL (SSP411 family)